MPPSTNKLILDIVEDPPTLEGSGSIAIFVGPANIIQVYTKVTKASAVVRKMRKSHLMVQQKCRRNAREKLVLPRLYAHQNWTKADRWVQEQKGLCCAMERKSLFTSYKFPVDPHTRDLYIQGSFEYLTS